MEGHPQGNSGQGNPPYGYYGYQPQMQQMQQMMPPQHQGQPQHMVYYNTNNPNNPNNPNNRRPVDQRFNPSSLNSHYPPMPGFTKIYLGQLPLHITEQDIEDVFNEYC